MATKSTRVYSDIDAAFLAHPTTGDATIKTNDRAIKFAIKALVMTDNYERLFHSEIGTPVRRLLFDNIDDMSIILVREAVSDVITNYEPRVTVLEVNVTPVYDDNRLNIDIVYLIKNSNITSNVAVTLDRSR